MIWGWAPRDAMGVISSHHTGTWWMNFVVGMRNELWVEVAKGDFRHQVLSFWACMGCWHLQVLSELRASGLLLFQVWWEVWRDWAVSRDHWRLWQNKSVWGTGKFIHRTERETRSPLKCQGADKGEGRGSWISQNHRVITESQNHYRITESHNHYRITESLQNHRSITQSQKHYQIITESQNHIIITESITRLDETFWKEIFWSG